VRSIAHDVGQGLGCGAHLKSLRRTQAGDFTLDDAHTLEELGRLAEQGRFEEAMIPAARLLPQFPSEHVDEITAGQIRNGRTFRVSPFHIDKTERYVKALNSRGDLIAIGEARLPHVYHPVLVL
jgi:tRNA pseudouridine55 synthase